MILHGTKMSRYVITIWTSFNLKPFGYFDILIYLLIIEEIYFSLVL